VSGQRQQLRETGRQKATTGDERRSWFSGY
jgi:hypothetical protein